MMMRFFICALFLFNGAVSAQFKQDISELKEKYKAYNAIYLENESTLFLDVKDDKIVASQEVKEQVLILNDHSKAYSNDNIYFSGFSSVHDIKAKSYLPKGDKFEELEATTFKETHDISRSVFYDDSKLINFTFPGLKKGAITSLEYRLDYQDPRFLRKFFFQSFIPSLHSKYVIKYHKDIKMDYRIFHLENLPHQFKEYQKGKYKYMVWEANNMPELKPGNENYNLLYYAPHIIPLVNELSRKGKTEHYYGSIDDLYQFYYSYIKDLDVEAEQLKVFVGELLKDANTADEKAKRILYWVQDNIKYVAFEQGMRGFVPNTAEQVFEKRYGDCKDMTSIIKKMMDYAGLPCYYSWVGTRGIPYTYAELPSVQTDNHMVAAYLKEDSVIVMDGTLRHLNFGQVPDHIQGKDMLIAISKEEYRIVKLPVVSEEYSQIVDSVDIQIDQETVNGRGKRSHLGYNRMEMGYAIFGKNDEKLKKTLNNILNKGNNKCTLNTFEVKEPEDRDKSIDINYEFKVEDYVRSSKDEIYVNLNLEKSYKNLTADSSLSVAPINNDFHFIKKDITSLEIPPDYHLEYLPKNSNYTKDDFWFKIDYRTEGNRIIQEKNICFQFLNLKASEFADWNQMIKQLNKAYRETIVLKHQDQ
jgi:hypothetical protein